MTPSKVIGGAASTDAVGVHGGLAGTDQLSFGSLDEFGLERPIRVRDYLATTKACKLHDFATGTWHTYPA